MYHTLLRIIAFTKALSFDSLQTLRGTLDSVGHGFWPSEKLSDPVGVGFELSLDYATAVLAYPNGTFFSVVRIDGDSDYNVAMTNFANESLQLHPRDSPNYFYSCFPLPPPLNDDGISAITNMLRGLKEAVEAFMDSHITFANVAIPWLAHLCRSDIDTAMRHAGLTYLHHGVGPPNRTSLYTTSAVMVSNRVGICSDYKDIQACDAEEAAMAELPVPHIEITRKWLHISCPHATSAYNYTNTLHWYIDVNLMLKTGLDHRHDESDPDADPDEPIIGKAYWDRVYFLIGVNTIAACGARPTFQLLSGEGASDPDFQRLLKMFLTDYEHHWHIPPPPVLQNHTLFAAAEGAAELAKRALWRKAHT